MTVAPCSGTINNRGELAGFSCGPNGCRAVVYVDHQWTALNTLTLPGWSLDPQIASSIKEEGQIAGQGTTTTGEFLRSWRRVEGEE